MHIQIEKLIETADSDTKSSVRPARGWFENGDGKMDTEGIKFRGIYVLAAVATLGWLALTLGAAFA